VTPDPDLFFKKIFDSGSLSGSERKRRFLPELTPALRIRGHLWFAAACDQAGAKLSTKITKIICLSRNPRQCVLQENDNTLQQVEKLKYLGVVFTNDERRTKRMVDDLKKQTQFCVSFMALRSQNGSFQNGL